MSPSEQILGAFTELLRGFQPADPHTHADPRHLYRALLTALLRLVFLRHADHRGLLPADSTRLADRHGHPHGAWSALLARSRRTFTGGPLCDPDSDPLLAAVRLSDAAVARVLAALPVADVEQIGNVYEALIDLKIEPSRGPAGLHALIIKNSRDQRRRTGSHYTPRALTGPIVATTLRPVLEQLGDHPTPEQLLDLKICDPATGSGAFLVEACRQLGDHLVRAWEHHRSAPPLAPDEQPRHHARLLVALHCLHGVDRDPIAVDLARLSLWLVTRARHHPFTFLDRAIKHGDSLVGLSSAQIAAFRWDHATGDPVADISCAPRLIGDAAIATFFAATSDKRRNQRRAEILIDTIEPARRGDPRAISRLEQLAASLREGDRPVFPFHWQIEFPEVFARDNPGFDCFVGNPPFLGGKRILGALGKGTLDLQRALHDGSNGNADLAAFFFRRAFDLTRRRGTLGFLATNTIAQGDTRAAGLQWICTHGGAIYEASRRRSWPGDAAVVFSVVHVQRADAVPRAVLDGKPVPKITAFLFHGGGHGDPAPLAENAGKSFIGSYVLGMGFTFSDADPDATPIAEMRRLISEHPANQRLIFPYLGGAELNAHPRQEHARYVINFGEMSESEARRWPDLLAIVERKVRPGRMSKPGSYRAQWWLFGRRNLAGQAALQGLDRVLAISRVSRTFGFAFVPAGHVCSEGVVLFAHAGPAALAVLQSRVHDTWARFFGSSMKDDLRYSPTDCFEPYPFPAGWADQAPLELVGAAYHDHRAGLMQARDQGLTATYNQFNDPDVHAPDIVRLRELHAELDRAVLTAYGWTDLAARAACEFRLDYEDHDPAPARPRKRPWRYRWPQDLHDEVLARLLDLNHERAAQQRRAPIIDTRRGPATTSRAPAAAHRRG